MVTTPRTSIDIDSDIERLPAVVRTYLGAHTDRDVATAAACFADDAVVEDDGSTYRGRDEIATWLGRSSSEYSYTTTLGGAVRRDDRRWDVESHLEGDFPGGVVDLTYAFTLDADRIAALTIAPTATP